MISLVLDLWMGTWAIWTNMKILAVWGLEWNYSSAGEHLVGIVHHGVIFVGGFT